VILSFSDILPNQSYSLAKGASGAFIRREANLNVKRELNPGLMRQDFAMVCHALPSSPNARAGAILAVGRSIRRIAAKSG
jgi:hypothetical protein